MKDTWAVSPAPHLRSPESTPHIMWQVAAALAPAGLWALIQFGVAALWVAGLSIGTCLVVEAVLQRWRGVPVTINDGSAFVTGLLLAYVLPSHVTVKVGEAMVVRLLPWYVPVVGAVVAIAIAKQAFGGLGHNIWNPALVGRAFVQVSFPAAVSLTLWATPHYSAVDATTAATPLATTGAAYSVSDLFFGLRPGSMGEISSLLLLLGGVYLIARRYVDWRLPLCYFGAVLLLSAFLPLKPDWWLAGAPWVHNPIYHVFAGGVMLGALFMASDVVTSPLTRSGQAIFGLGCGVLTVLIRFYTHGPEGVCYAILLMNTVRPLIDRHTRPRVFGARTPRSAT